MPKRWRVLLSGDAHADISSAEPDAFRDAGNLGESYADIVADTLEVSAGALVFWRGGAVEYVFSTRSYWVVLPSSVKPDGASRGDVHDAG
jgi:hypothetical protein